MNYGPARLTDNIERTIQSMIGDSITVNGTDYAVYHDAPWADPGGARVDEADAEALGWVETRFISSAAGRKGASVLQVDVYRRMKTEDDPDGDPYGAVAVAMTDEVTGIFTGVKASGVQRGFFHVQDWTDPLSPTDTEECMLCINTRLQVGEPEFGPEKMPAENGLRRVMIRLRFTLGADTVAQAFYT